MRHYAILPALLIFAAPSLYAQNLVVNGDAEAGPGGDGVTIIPPPFWNVTGDFTTVLWSTPGWMSPSDPGPPDRGNNYFAGGFTPISIAVQIIDLSAHAAVIDKGIMNFDLHGWLGGWDAQNDNAVVDVDWKDAAGMNLGVHSIGPVLASHRNNATGLLERSLIDSIPISTRSAHVYIILTRTDQTYNDGYADNVSLELIPPLEPILTVTNLVAGQQASLDVTSATPNGIVAFAYSLTGTGPTILPSLLCRGIRLSLSQPIRRIGSATANGLGEATIVHGVPVVPGLQVHVQALDFSTCMTSNVVTEFVQ
jgi:hypothetical protein